MDENQEIIAQTRNWIETVIVANNFCPFAARELQRDSISYRVVRENDLESCLLEFADECGRLDQDQGVVTSLLIFPQAFDDFDAYLDLLEIAEALLLDQGYEGIYQVASFHPDYRFGDSEAEDPADYTNRSPYPMLHILRESSIDLALRNYPRPESIPERNIETARRKGLTAMQSMLEACRARRR